MQDVLRRLVLQRGKVLVASTVFESANEEKIQFILTVSKFYPNLNSSISSRKVSPGFFFVQSMSFIRKESTKIFIRVLTFFLLVEAFPELCSVLFV